MSHQAGGLKLLSDAERDVVRQCLDAAANGPFFPEQEYHTIFGLQRSEVAAVLSRWPNVDDADETVHLAINNSLNNLLGYPHRCEGKWPTFIHVSPTEVARVFKKWRGSSPRNCFEGLE